MRHLFQFAAATTLMLTASFAVPAFADEKGDDRAAIQAAYDRSNLAGSKLDPKGAVAHQTDDYINISSTGHVTQGKDERAMQQAFLTHTKTFKGTTVITSFELSQNKAHVRVKEHVEAFTEDPQTGKFINLVVDDNCDDDWIKTTQGWRLAKSKNSNTTVTVDGKKAD